MNTIPQSRMEAGRFASYIEELRDFAAGYRMRVGSSDDLHTLREALDRPGSFRDECASMVRSVIYRERGKADPEDLLTLVITAWGGSDIDRSAESLQPSLSAISVFLAGVMRVHRDSSPMPSRPVVSPNVAPDELPEPVSYEYVPPRRTGIYTAAAQTAEVERLGVRADPPPAASQEVEARDDLDSTLKELEAESPDVQLYLQLLKQRVEKQPDEPDTGMVVLDERFASAATLAAPVPEAREDPWDKNSELQRELRRFAAEREAREAEHRVAKAARAPYIKFLFIVERWLFRWRGPDNLVRHYLSKKLKPSNLERRSS